MYYSNIILYLAIFKHIYFETADNGTMAIDQWVKMGYA